MRIGKFREEVSPVAAIVVSCEFLWDVSQNFPPKTIKFHKMYKFFTIFIKRLIFSGSRKYQTVKDNNADNTITRNASYN